MLRTLQPRTNARSQEFRFESFLPHRHLLHPVFRKVCLKGIQEVQQMITRRIQGLSEVMMGLEGYNVK